MSTDLQQPREAERSSIPRFLRFSIFALIGLTLLTIVALFVDSIEYRGTRITLTFVVFAAFVGLTALDTRKNDRQWYPPAALLSNGIFLGASLLTIWLTRGDFGLFFVAFYLVLVYALILRLGLLFGGLSMAALDETGADRRTIDAPERKASTAGAWLGGSAATLFVIYIAAASILNQRVLSVELSAFWDVYLKLSTAVLILAGLALAVSLLLRWYFGAEHSRAEDRAKLAAPWSSEADEPTQQDGLGQDDWNSRTPVQAEPQGELLPWPFLPNGAPYPQRADGQPDFERVSSEGLGQSSNSLDRSSATADGQSPVRPPANAELRNGDTPQ